MPSFGPAPPISFSSVYAKDDGIPSTIKLVCFNYTSYGDLKPPRCCFWAVNIQASYKFFQCTTLRLKRWSIKDWILTVSCHSVSVVHREEGLPLKDSEMLLFCGTGIWRTGERRSIPPIFTWEGLVDYIVWHGYSTGVPRSKSRPFKCWSWTPIKLRHMKYFSTDSIKIYQNYNRVNLWNARVFYVSHCNFPRGCDRRVMGCAIIKILTKIDRLAQWLRITLSLWLVFGSITWLVTSDTVRYQLATVAMFLRNSVAQALN